MNKLGVNQLFNLSKDARKNKDYILENKYLNEALKISPTNIKIINAYIRNLKRIKNQIELKKWLYILYDLNPNGVIISELIKLEREEGNIDKVNYLLIENLRLNPNSKKIKRRIEKRKIIMNEVINKNREENKNTELELINKAREIIYSNDEYEEKKKKIIEALIDKNELISICILSEFYVNESLNIIAFNLIKKYKGSIDDKDKIKVINKLLQLVMNKKIKLFNWNDFWQENIHTICDIKEEEKVFIKYM